MMRRASHLHFIFKNKTYTRNFATSPRQFDSLTSKLPDFVHHRQSIFERLYAEQQEILRAKPRKEIQICLPHDRIVEANAWDTTPASIALSVSQLLHNQSIVADVDGELWDLKRPLERSCTLKLLDFDHPEGMELKFATTRVKLTRSLQAKKSFGIRPHMC